MARRPSYASVLGGPPGGSARSGFMTFSGARDTGSISHTRSPSAPLPAGRAGGLSQSYGGSSRTNDPFDGNDLPPYPGSLGAAAVEPRTPAFYIPSYLKHSRHAEKLEEKHKARSKSHRDGTARHSTAGTLSRSGSGISLHKMVPSHRGMTYDIQEKFSGFGEEVLAPLPSRWSSHDKYQGVDVSADGFDVHFANPVKSAPADEAASLRADHPMPRACGVYYFEITVLTKGKEAPIGIGFSGPNASVKRLPGWEPESWAYHSDDGLCFNQTHQGKSYGPKFGHMDIIGCGVNFKSGEAFFTRNGHNLGVAFKDIRGDKLYPSVGMKKPGERIRANFGLTPFVYDINGHVARVREALQDQIASEPITHLHESKKEPRLLQELVLQYLAHEGYTETTKAFSQEGRHVEGLLSGENDSLYTQPSYKEDLDAINRQRIRSEILRGDIDAALKHTRAYYPSVLDDNENIYFRLKCRKFIEMIKSTADLAGPPRTKRTSSSSISYNRPSRTRTVNGYRPQPRDDPPNIFSPTGEMDIDPSPESAVQDQPMTEVKNAPIQQGNLMTDALIYGRELQREFKDDPSREVKEALEQTFALIAYPDARESSLAHLLEEDGRIPVAEELNSAILVSLGQSSSAALERLVQQTDILAHDISVEGGGAALLNLRTDYLRDELR